MTAKSPPWHVAHYHIERRIGSGATSVVYSALDLLTGRKVALKVLNEALTDHENAIERFRREAWQASKFDHPNVLNVIDSGQDKELHYLVMPLLESTSLGKMIDQQGPLELERALELIQEILAGLAYLHTRGVLHRDFKAENVLLDHDGRPQICDFGLVFDPCESRITQDGGLLGTPYYMPPEQWRGEELDERADIFAAGVMLFFMLTRDFPWNAEDPVAMFSQLISKPPALELLPPQLQPIIGRAISLDASARYPSVGAFASALANLDAPRSSDTQELPLIRLEDGPSQRRLTLTEPNPSILGVHRDLDARNLALHPVEFAEGSYWVGKREPGNTLYSNPYLRTFKGQGTEFNVIIDPGSSSDFSVVQAKSSRIIGSLERLSAVFINHQDPDVGSSAGVLLGRYSPEAYVLCAEDTWRLIQYFNLPKERFVPAEKYPEGFSLPTGHSLRPIASPFCHFVGATMLFDPRTRVLYTGDLFGAIVAKGAKGIFADESDWVGMRAFHQIYMPMRQAIAQTIATIRAIPEGVEIIAPHHGRLIKGPWIKEFMTRLESLPVGLDILTDRMASQDELIAWSTVLERVLDVARGLCAKDLRGMVLEDPNLRGLIRLRSNRIEIMSLGKFVVERALTLLCNMFDEELMSMVRYEVMFATNELSLPTPNMSLQAQAEVTKTGSMLGKVWGPSQ